MHDLQCWEFSSVLCSSKKTLFTISSPGSVSRPLCHGERPFKWAVSSSCIWNPTKKQVEHKQHREVAWSGDKICGVHISLARDIRNVLQSILSAVTASVVRFISVLCAQNQRELGLSESGQCGYRGLLLTINRYHRIYTRSHHVSANTDHPIRAEMIVMLPAYRTFATRWDQILI